MKLNIPLNIFKKYAITINTINVIKEQQWKLFDAAIFGSC